MNDRAEFSIFESDDFGSSVDTDFVDIMHVVVRGRNYENVLHSHLLENVYGKLHVGMCQTVDHPIELHGRQQAGQGQ